MVGLLQDCNNSSALAMELLQSCTKPLTCCGHLSFSVTDKTEVIKKSEISVKNIVLPEQEFIL